MSWLVWGGFVRTIFVLHSTWLVNSASHVWGYRSHATRDKSTNLWWVALLTYGEGWHNNHHAFQTSARHGLRWWEVDMTYMAIRLMKLCRDRLQHQAAQDSPAARRMAGVGAMPMTLVDDPNEFVPSGVDRRPSRLKSRSPRLDRSGRRLRVSAGVRPSAVAGALSFRQRRR